MFQALARLQVAPGCEDVHVDAAAVLAVQDRRQRVAVRLQSRPCRLLELVDHGFDLRVGRRSSGAHTRSRSSGTCARSAASRRRRRPCRGLRGGPRRPRVRGPSRRARRRGSRPGCRPSRCHAGGTQYASPPSPLLRVSLRSSRSSATRRAITSTPSTAAALAWARGRAGSQVAADAGDMTGALALGVGRRRGSVFWFRSPCWFSLRPLRWSWVRGPSSLGFPRSWVGGSGVRGRTGFHGPRGFRFEVGFGFSWQVPDFHAMGLDDGRRVSPVPSPTV